MVARRVLALLLVASLLTVWMPAAARAAGPTEPAAAVAGGFTSLLLRDAEVQELLQSAISELPPATQDQLEQLAQLAASGATPQEVEEQAQLIIRSLPEATRSSIEQLMARLSYRAGLVFMLAALFKFWQAKQNATHIQSGMPVAMVFIAAALLFLPSVLGTGGGALFPPPQIRATCGSP